MCPHAPPRRAAVPVRAVPTAMATVAPKISVIFYSTYGHVKILVDAAVEGLKAAGAEVKVFRVPETLPEDVLAKMHASGLKHNEGVPEVPRDTWHEADGFIFAFPTRFGGMPAQMKAFFDATGGLWQTGGLQNKYCGAWRGAARVSAVPSGCARCARSPWPAPPLARRHGPLAATRRLHHVHRHSKWRPGDHRPERAEQRRAPRHDLRAAGLPLW